MLYGYGGFRIHHDHLSFNPTLPSNSSKMTITGIGFLGNQLRFQVSSNDVIVSVIDKEDIAPSLEIVSNGKTFILEKTSKITLPKGKGLVRMRSKPTVSSRASRDLHVGLCVFVILILLSLTVFV